MDQNNFKNIFIYNHNENHMLETSFLINDTIFDNNDIQPFYIDNKINPNVFLHRESYVNDINNLEYNNNPILSDTNNLFAQIENCSKINKAQDNCLIDNIRNNNSKDNHAQNYSLLKKESFKPLDYNESKILSQHKKKRGRKSKKIDNSFNEFNKFSNDNNIRKCKTLVLTYSLGFLNHQIMKIYNGNIGHGIHMKKLLDISQEYKANNTINHMRKFVKKTLKEIFSVDISKKYTSFLSNHNEVVIKKILNDNDDEKRKKFEKLFSLTFIDCIKKFLGENILEEFDGFPTFDEVKFKLNEDTNYLEKLKESLINFEDIIKNIKPRKNKSKKKKSEL